VCFLVFTGARLSSALLGPFRWRVCTLLCVRAPVCLAMCRQVCLLLGIKLCVCACAWVRLCVCVGLNVHALCFSFVLESVAPLSLDFIFNLLFFSSNEAIHYLDF